MAPPLNRDTFSRIKRNDPDVTNLAVSWSRDDPSSAFARKVDWKKEGLILGENTQLKRIEILGYHDYNLNRDEYDDEEHDIDYDEDENFVEFCNGIALNRTVETLKISCCDFSYGGEIVEVLCSLIEHNDNLRDIVITGSHIYPDEGELAQALSNRRNKSSLRRFDLSGSSIVYQQTAEHLLTVLKGYRGLEELDLNGAKIGGSDPHKSPCVKLADILKMPQCCIKKLDISQNRLGNDDCKLLSNALANNQSLQTLNMTRNQIDDEGAVSLGNVLANNTTLKELLLTQNRGNISSVGWRAISACLQNPSSALEVLSMRWNTFDNDALLAFGNAIANNRTLKVLRMDNYSISPTSTTEGLQRFATCLRNPASALEELWLLRHYFDDDAIIAFANALRENRTLRTLWISPSQSGITDKGWLALQKTLCNTSSVQAIHDSNHTLEVTCESHSSHLDWLRRMRYLNRNNNKAEVARQKILQHHFLIGEVSIAEFVDMKVQVLPQAISWIGRDDTGRPLLYQLVRGMVPSLFDFICKTRAAGTKRKPE